MNRGNRFTGSYRFTGLFVQFQTYAVIDHVVMLVAAAAENQAGQSHLFALNSLDKTVRLREERRSEFGYG